MIVHSQIQVHSGIRVSFFDVSAELRKAVAESGIKDGLAVVYSQHTSCSVFIQEDSEDLTYWETPLVLQDMLNLFDEAIPVCTHEGQYLHPGPIHTKNAMDLRGEKTQWLLNTDAHLRSVLLGRSVTIPIVAGEPILGEFGCVYFADFDQTRERDRLVHIQLIGD